MVARRAQEGHRAARVVRRELGRPAGRVEVGARLRGPHEHGHGAIAEGSAEGRRHAVGGRGPVELQHEVGHPRARQAAPHEIEGEGVRQQGEGEHRGRPQGVGDRHVEARLAAQHGEADGDAEPEAHAERRGEHPPARPAGAPPADQHDQGGQRAPASSAHRKCEVEGVVQVGWADGRFPAPTRRSGRAGRSSM